MRNAPQNFHSTSEDCIEDTEYYFLKYSILTFEIDSNQMYLVLDYIRYEILQIWYLNSLIPLFLNII